MTAEFSGWEFQRRTFAAYEAIHSILAHTSFEQEHGESAASKGALAGAFVAADTVSGNAATLPVASLIAGACFLGLEASSEAARDLLRHGRCDFVVNSLDEALRILKNELRQKKPVAACVTGDVPANIQQMADRGVAPQVLFYCKPARECPAMYRLRDTGTILCETASLEEMLNRPGNVDGHLTDWSLPTGTTAMLQRLDVVAREVIPEQDRKRRRWLEVVARYLPRETPPARITSQTATELQRFLDGVSARLMSCDVTGPVKVTVDGEHMMLGSEAVA